MHRTLVLDAGYTPHRVVSWQRAVALVFSDKAEIVEEYDDEVTTVTLRFKVPAVIRLLMSIPRKKRAVRFSRVNIATRDKFKCQYCGCKLTLSKLTYDHVIPKAYFAKGEHCTTWENIVSCCQPCNSKKRNRTPEEAGMKLLAKPYKPVTLPMVTFHFELGYSIPDVWMSYVYWQGELDHD